MLRKVASRQESQVGFNLRFVPCVVIDCMGQIFTGCFVTRNRVTYVCCKIEYTIKSPDLFSSAWGSTEDLFPCAFKRDNFCFPQNIVGMHIQGLHELENKGIASCAVGNDALDEGGDRQFRLKFNNNSCTISFLAIEDDETFFNLNIILFFYLRRLMGSRFWKNSDFAEHGRGNPRAPNIFLFIYIYIFFFMLSFTHDWECILRVFVVLLYRVEQTAPCFLRFPLRVQSQVGLLSVHSEGRIRRDWLPQVCRVGAVEHDWPVRQSCGKIKVWWVKGASVI